MVRLSIFEEPADFDANLRVIHETWEIVPLPILAMVVMPNHWAIGSKGTTKRNNRTLARGG